MEYKIYMKIGENKMNIKLTMPEDFVTARIDKVLSEQVEGQSRGAVQNLCSQGKVLVNGKVVNKSCKLKAFDIVEMDVEPPVPLEILPENLNLDIVYEDDDLLVVNKPKGMVVHPAPGNYTGTMVNGLVYHCGDSLSGINGVIRPGIVHRIDKDTSGLLLVAKNDLAHRGLSEQIQQHTLTREYEAIVHGHFKDQVFTIDEPIGRCPQDRKKMCVTDQNAKNAVTHVTVLADIPSYSHVKCRLETGRTHQIRVHCAYYCHPIVGDIVYGSKKPAITGTKGQCLHAKTIGFVHPRTQEYMEFTSKPSPEFLNSMERLGFMDQLPEADLDYRNFDKNNTSED